MKLIDIIEAKISRKEISKRAAKRKYGESSSNAKNRYAQKHYRESGGAYR